MKLKIYRTNIHSKLELDPIGYAIIINKEQYPAKSKPTPARPKKWICPAASISLKYYKKKKGEKYATII